jgi:hypothetical protein
VEIADEETHRALNYVAAVSRQGYHLNVQEFATYMEARERSVRWALNADFADTFKSTIRGLATFGKPTVEPRVDWLCRLGWLEVDEAKTYLEITNLGLAVLRSLDEGASEPESPLVTMLDSQDPFAYAQVVGSISKKRTPLLIDPYFPLAALSHIMHFTETERILTGPKNGDLSALAVAMSALPPGRSLAVRVSDDVHDRFIVGADGPVESLGTSLSGIGRRFSVLTTINPPDADILRAACESKWANASPLDLPSGADVERSTTGQGPSE